MKSAPAPAKSRRRPGRRRPAATPPRRPPGPLVLPPWWALTALAAFALLLFAAPPDSNAFWGVNGFRSLRLDGRLGLLACACVAALLAIRPWRSVSAWWGVALPLAIVIAFPMRERIHLLGDTQVRLRSIASFHEGVVVESLRQWSATLHAAPLDLLVNLLGPALLTRLGLTPVTSVSFVSLGLAVAFFAGLWRVSGRLLPEGEGRVAFGLALATAGTLQLFAGFAESTGLLLACVVWWWATMLAPLDRPQRATAVAAGWLVVTLAHRVGFVMILPLAWRALGTPMAGDQPPMRRRLLVLSGIALGLAASALVLAGGGGQLASDVRDLLASGRFPRLMRGDDLANTLALIAPLAVLAPVVAGVGAAREPRARVLAVAALPLLLLAPLLPVADRGLGAMRDFDLNALLGFTLTLLAGLLLGTLPEPRRRGVLAFALPVLALAAFAWLGVNAAPRASERRAERLAQGPPRLPAPQLGTTFLFLGQRAMDLGRPGNAGAFYDSAFAIGGNPRRALLAAEAWAVAGDTAHALRDIAIARSRDLSPALQRAAKQIEAAVTPR